MKKNIFYLLILIAIVSCATKKPEKRSAFLKGFSTNYNTLFNAKDALNYEFESRDKAHKDNFYAPYIPLLTYDEQPVGSELGQTQLLTDKTTANARSVPGQPANTSATVLEIAEAKALKAIDKYSVTRDGEEKNKAIFDAYIVVAQSRIYQNKPLPALDALNYLFTNMKDDKRIPLAKIYQGLAYAKMKDYHKAEDIFTQLKSQKLDKDYEKLLSIYFSESLLNSGKKDKAIQELENAFAVNGNRKIKSRVAFLRGQILASQGKNEQARESFLSAYQLANDFEFEVKSQIEIAKTYNGKGDYNGAKEYLEKISKKGTYGSRKNEFYYALGLMAAKAGKKEEASAFFRKSLNEKVSDPQIRGLNYYEIGKSYLEDNEYISAGAFYDSALASMTYEPSKILLKEQSEYIKKIAKNYYLIKKNDSILALTRMNENQRNDYFAAYITKIKAKEEQEELARKRDERAKDFAGGDYIANSIFANNSTGFQDFSGSKGFYFANQNNVSKGSATFKQVWGNRALSDNWRYSARMSSIDDLKNDALGITSVQNPRRFEASFYTEKIPTDQNVLSSLKKDRDTASLGLGIMYENFFSNTPLATKTLYDLVDQKPEEKVMLQTLYEIFAMNYEKNPSAGERAKQILLAEYPYTSYAEFARNPRNNSFVKSNVEAENSYKTAFALYENERFEESKSTIEKALTAYPKDALVPKLSLLNAFNAGKTSGKEIMILQLEQIALNYGKTPEGEKAKEMLLYLKSDIGVQMTDSQGKIIVSPAPKAPEKKIDIAVPEEVREMQRKLEQEEATLQKRRQEKRQNLQMEPQEIQIKK
ncbi:MAG: tetratricopeptide repeat protein [Kaistella sp.]|nr:tetratricopeptide repeat protein [Kaistella sp.]